jgi:hypothetical protein
MLQEQETPAGAEYTCDLRQDRLGVIDGTERPGGDDCVDGTGIERKPFGWGLDDRCFPATLFESASQAFDHVGIGLGEHELADGVWIVLEVESGAGTKLECSSSRLGEELVAQFRAALALELLHGAVIDTSEQSSVDRSAA